MTFHTENSQLRYDLACDENMWKFWTDKEKSNFVRDPPLVNAINQGNWDIANLKAIDRILEYIRNGKICPEYPAIVGICFVLWSRKFTEEEFAERLYATIGYHGRNMRYRDDAEFWNLRYYLNSPKKVHLVRLISAQFVSLKIFAEVRRRGRSEIIRRISFLFLYNLKIRKGA